MALTRGQLFRRRTRKEYELGQAEELILDEIAEVIDTIDSLPSTAATEKRLQRALLSRLIGQLALPDDDGTPQVLSMETSRARRTARIKAQQDRSRRGA